MVRPPTFWRQRSRLWARRAARTDEQLGFVLIKSGGEAGGPAEPYRIGTTARVIGTTPLPGGRSFIIARGERRFEIASIDAEREPYLVGQVRYLDEDDGADAAPLADRPAGAFEDYLTRILPTSSDARSDTPLAAIGDGTPN